MIIINRVLVVVSVSGLLAGCAATQPPPLPPNNPADPQARESTRRPGSFLTVDATTRAINDRLKQSPEVSETHGGNMPGMQHDTAASSFYTCPMHPQVHQDKPGDCPICGMALIRKEGKPPQ